MVQPNYTPFHTHSMLSNGVTNVDSVTRFESYIEKAKEYGMTAFGFSEHGNLFEWYFKKKAIEEAGMKYLHGVELYVTMNEQEKVRDNYHCVAIAKDYEGFLELNRLTSNAFTRTDNHFYYVPRVFISELEATTDHIIITSACVGGAMSPRAPEADRERFFQFILRNKHRCFLEIQHHQDFTQVEHNQFLYKLSQQYGIPLIAGTDTHALDSRHVKGRSMLQISKNVRFAGEDRWDLTFKSYDELCDAYRSQGSLPEEVWLEAIANTNVMADMVQPFEIDKSNKYPNIYENPSEVFRQTVYAAAEKHPYAIKRHGREKLFARIEEELAVYDKTGATPYMLLKNYLTSWERDHDVFCGPGRGSVSGSMIAYLLHITEMDSMRFDLNFFRFMNPSRISLADIDTDYGEVDREKVKSFLLNDHLNLPTIQTAEIITFNTIATKGSIRDIAKAFNILHNEGKGSIHYSDMEIRALCDAVDKDGNVDERIRANNKQLFEYVDIVTGTVVSIGSHPCGVLVSDHDLAAEVGLCTTPGSQYPVSCLYMKELDELNWVKWDVLGLDNVALINQTCEMAGIERLTPDNVDLEDQKAWEEIRNDTTCIFQWESGQAANFLRRFMSDEVIQKAKARNPNFSMIKWMSFGNGLLRPACASYRDDVADGNTYDNGVPELNDFLAQEAGHVCMQETIMKWLVQFCGYSQAESDTVRRGIAKKKGTDKLLPEIEKRFIEYAPKHYDITVEKAKEVIKPFIQTIMDASSYAFSWNHSDAYSCIGYICGYLRTYYPLQFIAAALNVFAADQEKTGRIVEYAQKKNIKLLPPRYGYSRSTYTIDAEQNVIYKGIASIKYMNSQMAEEIYKVSRMEKREHFIDVLMDLSGTSVDSRQLDILIKLDFFADFGNANFLSIVSDYFDFLKQGTAKQISKDRIENSPIKNMIQDYGTDIGKDNHIRKSWVIQDIHGLLIACEMFTRSLHVADYDFRTKCRWQMENLGYIDLTTNKEEDRRKLLITDMRPMRSKDGGGVWGYALFTRSIGSGKSARMTLRAKDFEYEPVQKGDIVYAKHVFKNRAGYWYLDDYEVMI